MEKILEVKHLNVVFHTYAGDVKAVRDVSFDVNKGETLAIVGESGCGKSVTSKSILRLFTKDQAEIMPGTEILFQGRDVMKMSKKELRSYRGSDVGMIFQDPMTFLNPTMKIGDQIAEALRLHTSGLSKAEIKHRAIEMLKLVQIPNPEQRYDAYPHQFSGGMRQRIMIAIALSCNPSVLIADEPTTALDVTIQAQILELMMDIKKKLGTAIILVTHDLGVVANFANHIQVMYAGEIVERGTTFDIFDHPSHPYTRALLQSIPKSLDKDSGSLYYLKGTPPDLIQELAYCPFQERCSYCMGICRKQKPGQSRISDSHSVSCWLLDERAPRVDFLDGIRGEAR